MANEKNLRPCEHKFTHKDGKTMTGTEAMAAKAFQAAQAAAAEKIDTNIWELSDREREIIKSLGK